MKRNNIDMPTVARFGDEWSRFDKQELDEGSTSRILSDHFHIFPWERFAGTQPTGIDIGCGSERWAAMVAPRVGVLHCIEARGAALEIAKGDFAQFRNIRFNQMGVDSIPLGDRNVGFAYSLGVLHHVPDTAGAVRSVDQKLKSGALCLLYLYCSFDNWTY